jgi:hypothetical protein
MQKLFAFWIVMMYSYVAQAQYAWITDTIQYGAGITQDVYYSLSNGQVLTQDNKNWHIAFTMNASDSAGVWANHGSGNNFVKVFNIHKDSSQWNSVALADTSAAQVLFNNDQGWYQGAFNNMPGVNASDFGWGKYNQADHSITGDSLFIVRANGIYYKLWIKKLTNIQPPTVIYDFVVGDLTTGMDYNYSINKAPKYSNALFAHFNLSSGLDTLREPNINNWDIQFMRYTTNDPASGSQPNNNVIGVLRNKGVKVAKASVVHIDTAYNNYTTYTASWNPSISAIGYNWKKFDLGTGTWSTPDSVSYFIEDRNGIIWQLQFTYFGGIGSGVTVLRKRQTVPVSVQDVESTINRYLIYPVPAATDIHVMLDSKETASAHLQLVDLNGKNIIHVPIHLQAGLNAYTLPIRAIANGNYILSIKGEKIQIAQSILINQ